MSEDMEPNRNGVYYCGWGPHREQNTCIQFYMGNKLMCQLYVPYMYFLSSLLLSSKFLNPGLFAIGQLCLLLAISAPIFCWLCLPPDWSSKLSFITGVCEAASVTPHGFSASAFKWVPGVELRFPGLHGGSLHPVSHLAQLGRVF